MPASLCVERARAISVSAGWRSSYDATDVASKAAVDHTLDLVTFTPPAGWIVEEKTGGIGNYTVLTRASSSSYCRIAIYSGTPASSDLDASFDTEWTSVALQTIDRVAAPKPTMRTVGNVRAAVGGATSTVQGQPVLGMLIVLDAGASVVSMLVITPTVAAFDAYSAEVQAMLSTLVVRRVGAPPQPPTTNGGTSLVVPAPNRRIVVADLIGEWGRNDGINTTYVDRATGVYAGTDSLHFTDAWVITTEGGISTDFFGLENGRTIAATSTGLVALSPTGILTIRRTNERRYVLRGWLELPTMTVMKLNGPWPDANIPANILSDPEQGWNLDQTWVRLAKAR